MKLDKVFDCAKCNGTGHIRAFNHYAQGVCFQCNGTGKITLKRLEETTDVWLEYYKSQETDELRYLSYSSNGECDALVIVDFKKFKGDRSQYRKIWKEWESKNKTNINIL